jgi:hypothetical protein
MQDDLLRFFVETLKALGSGPEMRMFTTLLGALNTFLLRYGLDVTSRLTQLHKDISLVVTQAWRSNSRDPKLKASASLLASSPPTPLSPYLRLRSMPRHFNQHWIDLSHLLQVPLGGGGDVCMWLRRTLVMTLSPSHESSR